MTVLSVISEAYKNRGELFVFTYDKVRDKILQVTWHMTEAKGFSDSFALHFGGLDILACFYIAGNLSLFVGFSWYLHYKFQKVHACFF